MAKNKEISIFWMVVKFVTPVVVLLSFIPSPNGKPFIDWSDMMPSPALQNQIGNIINVDMSNLSTAFIKNTFSESKTTVYKWKDAKGQWHFSEEKPQHLKAETLTISNKLNRLPPPPELPSAAKTTNTNTTVSTSIPTGLPYGNITQLIKDAKNLQNVADERAAKLNNL
ncbi:MAG: DUF4124 domain-containing protein [Pseudomonadales bacterium]|nr:DUF4124 domain-containing protein [Pseudomonadales bacterium]